MASKMIPDLVYRNKGESTTGLVMSLTKRKGADSCG